jgi:hypothetical protein
MHAIEQLLEGFRDQSEAGEIVEAVSIARGLE